MTLQLSLSQSVYHRLRHLWLRFDLPVLICLLSVTSAIFYIYYLQNGLGLSYNDARSHLDIGRRVVENLKPGLAQIGSVWLPLTHLLMVPTVWNDYMWHSGLSGAIQSMVAYVATGLLIYKFLERLRVGRLGRWLGVFLFAGNLNILYLQSTAMTELMLLATMTAGCYYLLLWLQQDQLLDLLRTAFFVMLSTLIRYDGWFLMLFVFLIIFFHTWKKKGWTVAEGTGLLFVTLAGIGVALWFLWNLVIFKDPLYFAFGPFSARAQQAQLEQAGVLVTKGSLWLSLKTYFYAFAYNSVAFTAFLGLFAALVLWLDKALSPSIRLATIALLAPFIFNVLALYLGHSVLFVPALSGNSLFNIRYGVMMLPSIAIFVGYLVHRLKLLRPVIIGLLAFTLFYSYVNLDAVSLDDARYGSSQKNVTEVSGWLHSHAANQPGFILLSVASHDAIVFSSGLPMQRFIHEGTGMYWEAAIAAPDHWARWIIVRTHDDGDSVWKALKNKPGLAHYDLIGHYPFADIYQLKPEYVPGLITTPVFNKQK